MTLRITAIQAQILLFIYEKKKPLRIPPEKIRILLEESTKESNYSKGPCHRLKVKKLATKVDLTQRQVSYFFSSVKKDVEKIAKNEEEIKEELLDPLNFLEAFEVEAFFKELETKTAS